MEAKEITYKDKYYPKRLLNRKDYPKKLYCLGNLELLNNEKIFAIVGSRNCSQYGSKTAFMFANELSKEGITIISGMAIGIDALAHSGAMEEAGKTIAVLGGGFNNIYPKENEWLFNKILSNDGCIISEYAPDVRANTKNFPKRNRLISGISNGVLVVEAQYRSGSAITAGLAKEEGKRVYAIPSNIDSSKGIGTNKLILNGAMLTMKPSQILQDFNSKTLFNNTNLKSEKNIKKVTNIKSFKENKINIKKPKTSKENINHIKKLKISKENINHIKKPKLPKEYKSIYNLLKNGSMHINEIARNEGKAISELNGLLILMEIDGYITRLDQNQYTRKE